MFSLPCDSGVGWHAQGLPQGVGEAGKTTPHADLGVPPGRTVEPASGNGVQLAAESRSSCGMAARAPRHNTPRSVRTRMDMRMMRQIIGRLAIFVAAAGFGAGCFNGDKAVGISPSKVIVFGDSLSDMGNIDDATFGVVPGSSYFGGRFSNGPAWVEWLTNDLGVGPLTPSTAGGNNFAYGGAQTSGASGIGGAFIRDLDEQLSQYFASRTVDPNALYVVWAGANDLFDGQTDVNVPTNRIAASLEVLLVRGARQFLVPNLPLLGKIPEYNRNAAASAAFDQLSNQYNATFEARIEQLAAANLTATFYRLDVAQIFSAAINNPAAWGLTNVTDPAAPGLNPGAFLYNRNRIVAHPEQYLFWDTIHPTAAIHMILGDYASRLLAGAPGDFDTDGEVDARDLTLWRAGAGAPNAVTRQGDADGDRDVDGADFLAWQRRVGSDVITQVSLANSIAAPEPSAALLAALSLMGLSSARRLKLHTTASAWARSPGESTGFAQPVASRDRRGGRAASSRDSRSPK